MSKHLAVESAGTKSMEQLEQVLCLVLRRRTAIQGNGKHRAEYTETEQAIAA